MRALSDSSDQDDMSAAKVEVCPAEHLLSEVGAQLGQARRMHATLLRVRRVSVA
jgi:hypothetical protein